MNVKSANRENNKLTLVVEIDAETFESGLNKAYNKNRKYVSVPGFRKGKVPRRVAERFYGVDVFRSDAIEEIFPDAYTMATEGWRTVGSPALVNVEYPEDGTAVITFETALYPEVMLGQYKELHVPKASPVVTDEEVETELDRKANEVARIITVERPAEDGDTAVIDFEGFLDGVPFEGGKGENHELLLGSGSFVPGFEEQVVGMSAGEEKDIDITFPENYTPELAGKAVVFHVKVHEVKKTEVPEKDDELAKDVSEFDTLEELRADIRADLLKKAEEKAEDDFREAVMKKALEAVQAEIPEAMIDAKTDERAEQFASQLRSQGLTLEQYAKYMGVSEAEFKKNFMRPGAEDMVKLDLLLEAVAKKEELEATEEEIKDEYDRVAKDSALSDEEIRKYVPEDMIKSDVVRRKARDLIVESAVADAPEEKTGE